MPHFVCSQGHSWSARDGDSAVCPRCADEGTVLADPTCGLADEQPAAEPHASSRDGWPALPDHEILGVLGHGGMGVVYEARQVKLGRVVAVKMIQSGSGAGEEERRRFRMEAEAVARLQHPNIVQIYEVGDCRGQPYISLEYVRGGSLARRIASSLPPPGEAAVLVETLARAVSYAHQRGIVHRDLKPANILLCADGLSVAGVASGDELAQGDTISYQSKPLGTPKIADFGLAKQIDDDSGQTRSGAVMGTPSYMAPEQAAGQTAVIGPCTDVYALGAILYELLTGRPPFRAASVLETLDQVRNSEPVQPRQLQPALPRDLETICLKCLQKEPGRRYPSALALADDLKRFQAHEPIAARPIGALERGWRWCRRKPALASLTGALVLLAAASLVVVTVLYLQADRERRRIATLNASLTLERGQAYCEQGDVVRGMFWMAYALELAPTEAADLQRVIRANLAGWSRQLHPLEAIFPHDGKVHAVALSPDGSKVAVGGLDGRVQLWDVATGERLGPALTHEKEVLVVAFSPDGRVVASGGLSGAHWWDVASGRRIGPTVPDRNRVDLLAFSPDSTRLLTATNYEKNAETCRLWDVGSGKPVVPPLAQESSVGAVAFSPDGRLALAGGMGWARLWQAATGQPVGRVLEHPGQGVHAAVFRPDGQVIVTVAQYPGKPGATLSHWKTDTGERIKGPYKVDQFAGFRSFRRDAEILVVLEDGGGTRLWDVATGKAIGPPLKHDAMLNGAVFTQDGRRVLTASGDFTARVWDATTALPLGSPLQHHEGVWSVAVSPDGQMALTGSHDRTAKLWRLSPAPARVLGHEGKVLTIAFSPDGETLWTSCNAERDSIRSWDLQTGQARERAFSTSGDSPFLALSRDAKWLAAGSTARTQRWDLGSGLKIEPDVITEGRTVFALAISPDSAKLAVGCRQGTVHVWDNGTNRFLYTLKHDGEVRAVDFHPDGQLLMTAADDRTVRFWNAATGEPVGAKRVYNGAILAAVFSPDGKSYLAGGNDRIARQWDTATGAPVGPVLSHEGIVLGVAFSPDGRHILTGAVKTARLWDAATGKTVGPPIVHQNYVWSVAISPDGKTLASGSLDRTVQLVDTPQPVGGTTADVVRWVQVVTGHELDADGGIRVLEAARWRERRDRLNVAEVMPKP